MSLNANRRENRLWNQNGIGKRREFYEPYAVIIFFQQFRRDLKRETRLAHAARASERDETMRFKLLFDLSNFILATDERRKLCRQIVRE